ncbi:MBG domain-containing protein [Parvibaculum sp.]|uniref:MBG domain-containing protein n=1 Tax=Parvibaculum sp. TaxID=2024848 RepID=UPI000C8E6CEA|nr:MBG domain-containing protein [Parvibaculum sp.]MAB12581.1 hypothetical protein [Parvibaculum sp.]
MRTGGSFAATTLEADETAFMSDGALSLSGQSEAPVVNLGKIAASSGDVVLAAHSVRNEGEISAGGRVAMAAAHHVELSDMGEGVDITVRVSRSGDVENKGFIKATVARLESAGGNVYALAGNTDGAIRVSSATREGGRVLLRAAGRVEINSRIDASGEAGDGGHIVAEGAYVALGAQARIDARGAEDGGTVNLGGGWQGGDPDIRNAETLLVASGAEISVDGAAGNGGEAVLWADGRTDFAGHVNARGDNTGQGGRVEVSGKKTLSFAGTVDTGGGTLLLDPTDISIVDTITGNATEGALSGDYGYAEQESVDASEIEAGTLASLLETNNVTITTVNPSGNGSGNITVEAAVTSGGGSGSTTLTLNAENDIEVNAAIGTDDTNHPLGVTLQAGNDITVSDTIETGGAAFNAVANNNIDVVATGAVDSGGGDIFIRADDDADGHGIANGTGVFSIANGGSVVSGGGDIRIEMQGLNIYGPSLSATALDAGAGDVFIDLSHGGHIALARRGTIGIHNDYLYLFSDDLSKVSAANLHINQQKKKGSYKYFSAYNSADQQNWGIGISDEIHLYANGGITIYGGFANIETALFIENSAGGYNDLAISNPLSAKGDVTLVSPQLRLYTYGYYVRSTQGDLYLRTNSFNYFTNSSLRATVGTVNISSYSPGALTAPNAALVSAPRLVYGDAGDTTVLTVGAMTAAQTANITTEIVFQASNGVQFNGIFESENAVVALSPDSDGDLSGAVTFADGAGITSGGDLTLDAGYFGPESPVFNGSVAFRATRHLTVDRDLSVAGNLLLGADADENGEGTLRIATGRTVSVTGGGAPELSLLAPRMKLDGNVSATTGSVHIQGPGHEAVDLGSTTDDAVSTIELSQAEIARIAANELYIGDRSVSQADIEVTGAIDLSGVGAVSLLTDNDFTIRSGGSLTADGDLVIAANSFTNEAGAAALDAGTGRYLVYSVSPLVDDVDGLSGARRYARSYSVNPPSTISESGDFFFYTYAPVLTLYADNVSRAYGDANPAFSYTVDVNGLVAGDSLAEALSGTVGLSTTATAQSDVGDYAVNVDMSGASSTLGYSFQVLPATGTLTVNQRVLEVTADNASKTYGDANPAFSASVTGGGLAAHHATLGDALADLGFATAAGATSDAGTYAIEVDGTNANYALTFLDGTLTIDPKSLTVTADDASKIYGDVNPAFSASITGGGLAAHHATLGDALVDLGFATAAGTTSDVGTYAIEVEGTNANYDLTFLDGTLTVDPKSLTVTADDASRLEGEAAPVFTASFDGFLAGDGVSSLSGSLLFASSADTGSPPGDYTIRPSGLTSTNYAITYVDGVLVVLVRPVTPSNDAFTETFDVMTRPVAVQGPEESGSFFSGRFGRSGLAGAGGSGAPQAHMSFNGMPFGYRNGVVPLSLMNGTAGNGYFAYASGLGEQDGE